MGDYNWNPFDWDLYSNPYQEWLYEDNWDRKKYRTFSLLDALPVVRDYNSMLLAYRQGEEYLNRYGLDYSDIHNPRNLHGSNESSAFLRSSLNYVSKNIGKLYQ